MSKYSLKYFATEANRFFKLLNGTFCKCFKKIKIKSGSKKPAGDEIQGKLKLRTDLQKVVVISNNKCKIADTIAKSNLEAIEEDLIKLTAAKNSETVKDILKDVETLEGKFSQNGFWKIKQKLCPTFADPPMAKHDKHGNVISAPTVLKQLYLKIYPHKVRQREMKKELMDVYYLKMELWLSRL